jgi:hypothetical protein
VPLLLIAPGIGAVGTANECCQEIGLCLAHPANKRGRDLDPPSAQDETVNCRLDRRPDPGEVVEEFEVKALTWRPRRAANAPQNHSRCDEAHACSIALASRVRRLPPPIRAGNPERFYEERSQIAHDIAALAERVCRGPQKALPRGVNEPRNGRTRLVTSTQVINGNAVTVQRHRPAFSVFVRTAGRASALASR